MCTVQNTKEGSSKPPAKVMAPDKHEHKGPTSWLYSVFFVHARADQLSLQELVQRKLSLYV